LRRHAAFLLGFPDLLEFSRQQNIGERLSPAILIIMPKRDDNVLSDG
jgi:hypothetical protein